MFRITETPSKLGTGSIGKVLSLSKPSLALPTLLWALGSCFLTISVEAKQQKTMATLNAQQIAALLQKEGIAREKIPTMTAIALAESGGRQQAFNPTGLDRSYGLFQVNMYGGLGPARMKQFGLKEEKDLFDPSTNVRAAKQILGSQGLGAWSVYKSGKYKEFLPAAQKAVGALGQPQPEQTQKPQEISAANQGGRVFIINTGDENEPDTSGFLRDFIDKRPGIKPLGIDPAALLAQAFMQTPNYLGGA
jgi:hypothetical protein